MAAPALGRKAGFEPADAVTRTRGGPDQGSTVPLPAQNPGRVAGQAQGDGGGNGGAIEANDVDGLAGATGGCPAIGGGNGLGSAFRTMKPSAPWLRKIHGAAHS